jgi:nucleoside-diphosphate-sugar epimerase
MASRAIFLTGITGNLGAMAALRFLAQGHRIYAPVRSRHSPHLVRRRAVESLLAIAEGDERALATSDRLVVLDADVTDPRALRALDLPEGIEETWHFASSLKYMPKDRDEIHRANVDGLRNVLELHRSRSTGGGRFYYISTAYVAGRDLRVVPEARIPFDEDLSFNNEYERSKLLAENLVLGEVASGALDAVIFRPSIVTGRLHSGKLINYNGFYLGLKAWMTLSEYMKQSGRAGEVVRLWIDAASTLNLIPVDAIIDAMCRLRETESGAVFNVVNAAEVPLEQVFEILRRYLWIQPVLCEQSGEAESRKSTAERLVAYSLTYTAPYVKQHVRFDQARFHRALGQELRMPLYPDALDRLTRLYFERFNTAGLPGAPALAEAHAGAESES